MAINERMKIVKKKKKERKKERKKRKKEFKIQPLVISIFTSYQKEKRKPKRRLIFKNG